MRAASTSLLFLTLSTAILTTACDSTGETSTADYASALTCAPGTFRVAGTIDGMSVDVTESSLGGGFAQDGEGGNLGTQNNGGDAADPATTNLDLNWKPSLSVGDIGQANGTVRLAAPNLGGATLCLGAGSSVRSVEGGVQFHLAQLSSGTGCAVARVGSLDGCWR